MGLLEEMLSEVSILNADPAWIDVKLIYGLIQKREKDTYSVHRLTSDHHLMYSTIKYTLNRID